MENELSDILGSVCGHRHVIEHRLKIADGWWTERNMERMLQLRTARSNNWWDMYWDKSEIDRQF